MPVRAAASVAGVILACVPAAFASAATVAPTGPMRAPGAEEIAPYSKHPSGPEPYAACPEPTARRAGCMAGVVPTAGGEPLAGPALEGAGQLGGYSPQDIRSAYGLPAEGGAGMTVAITIAYDNPKAEADLATYRSHYGLPDCTTANGCFRRVNQDGVSGFYPSANNGWALESSLDMDMVSAACPRCHILLVEADSNYLEDLEVAVDQAAAMGADVISNSWAATEFEGESAEDPHFDHPGIPILFATGDEGYGVSYPAASPDAIAVGGTSLSKSEGSRGWTETAWSGAGSGCSAYEPKPSWQHDPGCAMRAVADVSAVADPQTPVSLYDSFEASGWELVGGTSVATPILAGVEAVSDAAFRDAGPRAFARAGNGSGMYDVTEGENGPCGSESSNGFEAVYLCQADTGYDGPTGWGTPLGPLRLPVAITQGADVESGATATLRGSVLPGGADTSYRFEYGPTTAYGHSVPAPEGDAGSGSDYVDVSEPVAGLEGQVLYHYRLTAINSAGTFHGVDRTFGTSPPAVATKSPKDVHAFDATLQGTVGPEGLATRYFFEFGLTTAYDHRAPAFAPSAGAGLADVPVESYVYGLRAGRVYHFRIVAVNSAGRTVGGDRLLVTAPAKWSAETMPQPPESGLGHEAFGVSCLASDDCIAVGGNWSLEVHTGVTLAERWDGSAWTVMDTPNPPGLDDGWQTERYALLRGVSCASGSACVAVGRFRDTSETVKPLAEIWDGSSWTIVNPPVPRGNSGTALEGVSCASASYCIAAGRTTDSSGTVRTLAERWDGSAWTAMTTPATPGAAKSRFAGVSCASAGACTAVGVQETAGGVEKTLAERWDGSSWVLQTTLDPSAGPGVLNTLDGVSCPTAGACTAVGSHWEKIGTEFVSSPLAERWNGTAWSTQTVPEPTGGRSGSLYGVSCATAGSCTAVGSYEAPAADPYSEVLGVRWNGTSWSALDMVGLADPLGWWHERWLHAVSCPEAEGCTAVGRGLAAPEGQLSPYQGLGEHETIPPYASFTTGPEQPAKGAAVEFDATGTIDPGHTIQSYEWDFGDGTTGSGATPAHAYAHAGDYAATLKVTDERGRSGEIAHLVTVTGTPPSASFTRTPASPTAGDTIEFDAGGSGDSDGSVVLYEWDFGDGAMADGETATHVYARAGRYQVKLSVTDNEGLVARATQTVQVADALPLAAFTVLTAAPTTGTPTEFDGSGSSDPDGTLSGYGWSFGDGTHGQGAGVSHAYARGGEYQVTLTVTDDEGQSASVTHAITVAGPLGTDDGGVTAGVPDAIGAGPVPAPDLEIRRAVPEHHGRILLVLETNGGGRLDATASAATGRGHPSRPARRRHLVYGRGSTKLAAAGRARLTISPGPGAVRALRRHRTLRVAVSVTFTPRGGDPVTKRRVVVFGRSRSSPNGGL